MRVQFLGGASRVGSLGMLLDHDHDLLLFDYGYLPSKPPGYPMKAPPVRNAYLSHAHIDHSGMVPWLCGRHDTNVFATLPTIATSDLLFEDSIKVLDLEGYPQPFDEDDLETTRRNTREMRWGETRKEGDLEITSHSAGHIPGATMYETVNREIILFTGDIHTLSTELVWGAKPVKCDTLVLESTYAGRRHPDRLKLDHDFLKKVEEILDRGGKVIIPAFAVGRTQEMLLILRRKRFEIWLDGMGKRVNRIYLDYPEALRSAMKLRKAVKDAKRVRSERGRERALKGEIIISTSGMLDGGPVLRYIDKIKDDPKSGILLTGYQVEGTNGRRLKESGVLKISGASVKVECEVSFFDFSAHADHDDLLKFIDGCDPERVILCHGDSRELLASDIEGREVLMPKEGEWVVL
ncbi:MAG: MBL fold metallo-hydrolase [Methanobacteriota archaeon]|nr:MAG: MBL fold metallo-hydrolase [Euryarchaeota archaeon]